VAVKSFRHKGLADFWSKGTTKGIRADLAGRVARCLALLNAATAVTDLRQVPSLRLHALHGDPQRWSISVNGPWRITFQWQDGNAFAVDLEQYH
jgi:proteic killer suppression protein